MTNLMQARSLPPAAMDDPGALEQFSEDAVDPLMPVLAALRRWEKGVARCAHAKRVCVPLKTAPQSWGQRDNAISVKLSLSYPEYP